MADIADGAPSDASALSAGPLRSGTPSAVSDGGSAPSQQQARAARPLPAQAPGRGQNPVDVLKPPLLLFRRGRGSRV